jgi:ribonuclease E
MLDADEKNTDTTGTTQPEAAQPDGSAGAPAKAARKRPAKKAAPSVPGENPPDASAPRKRAAKKAVAADGQQPEDADAANPAAKPAKKTAKKAAKKAAKPAAGAPDGGADGDRAPAMAPGVVFLQADAAPAPAKKAAAKPAKAAKAAKAPAKGAADVPAEAIAEAAEGDDLREAAIEEAQGARRRRRRGRRGRGGGGSGGADDLNAEADVDDAAQSDTDEDPDGAEDGDGEAGPAGSTHRRRRRRRSGGGAADAAEDDPPNTVVHVRPARDKDDDGVRGVKGSTRLEAKRQRRRDGRDTSRRRPPILTEAEFLARREAVERVMAIRQNGSRTQIAVLEDGVLVEHYVTRASATSYVGNVYLGRVQNVLPSMEAAFVDIGKGRNGVLYAGEVNWDAAGLEGKSRAIEEALKPGDVVLVQVTKDPIGHKGARLTSQITLPGRYLVFVPGGGMTGISRRLPDTERHRLKALLKKVVPEDAGVIIRTAAEGVSEEELTRDVERLVAQWEQSQKKAQKTSSAPVLVHSEPDLAIRVVRDIFNEDFARMIVQGEAEWAKVSEYIDGVAPDLAARVSRHTAERDLFAELQVDEQLMKGLDRKVWLPSGGSLVIDRTEAMTVIDVNTGKFVGSGGNLEQTVTRNNLEAAEEIVRQLRLRDVGGIVVIDFIDMVLESNRELVLRRLTECLGRDRTKHQVAEVTSLGLVQMTRKRVGEGLLEAFSEPCEVCRGRGVIVHVDPVERQPSADSGDDDRPKGRRRRGGGSGGGGAGSAVATNGAARQPELTPEEAAAAEEQRVARLAAMSAIHRAAHHEDDDALDVDLEPVDVVDAVEPVDVVDVVEPADVVEPVEPVDAVEPVEEAAEVEPAEVIEVAKAVQAVEVVEAVEAVAPVEVARPAAAPRRRRAASRPAGPPVSVPSP